jgi:hypothetical protein
MPSRRIKRHSSGKKSKKNVWGLRVFEVFCAGAQDRPPRLPQAVSKATHARSIDANDHLLGWFIRFSILGNFPLNLFVDALPNRVDPASGGRMGSSAHRWEEHSQQSRSLAIRNLRSQAHLQMTQLGRHSPREDFRNRAPNLCAGAALTTSISRNPEAYGPQDGVQTSAADVFDRPLPATIETFPPLFTMFVQLLLYYGVLQPDSIPAD